MVNLLDSLTKNGILSELHAKAVAKYAKDKSIPEILALQELGKNLKVSQLQFIIEKIYNDKETTMYEGNVSDIKWECRVVNSCCCKGFIYRRRVGKH